MLDKMKVILLMGFALQFLKAFFPSLDFGEEFEGALEGLVDSLYVLIPVVIGCFTRESSATVARLDLR